MNVFSAAGNSESRSLQLGELHSEPEGVHGPPDEQTFAALYCKATNTNILQMKAETGYKSF